MTATKLTVTLRSEQHFGRRVPAHALGCLLEVIHDAVRQSIRMAIEGRSRAEGNLPDWLKAAADIRFLGHEGTDETVLHFAAPTLGEAAPWLYEQQESWPTKPAREDTGFDVLGDVLIELTALRDDSERFDQQLLDTIYRLRHVLNGTFNDIEISAGRYSGGCAVSVTPNVLWFAHDMYTKTPSPQQVRVTGELTMVRTNTQSFGVVLDDGQEIRGVLTVGDIEQLRPLQDRWVTIFGKAVYRPTKKPLRIDAEEVILASDEEKLFSKIPEPVPKQFNFSETVRGPDEMGISTVMGKWPGDETDEQVEQALKELS